MAKVLSSISGNLISAASAGFAPTNSGDVSAIASAYQVVSATATQLYAGTAYLTSVNGAPVSASRAGNAANASMANSAYYDGTGRLISALPDSAAVSSIASSYAESAVSGKADSSSLSSYALSSDVSGVIDTVSTNSASWGAGASLPITGTSGDDSANYDAYHVEFTRYDTAGEPDIRTAILSPDSLWMDYTLDGNDHTSMTLNESMLDFGDSEGDHIVDAYSIDTWNSAVDTVANNSASWGQGGVDSATVSAIASSYAESAVSSKLDTTAQVVSATAGDGVYITSINGLGLSGQGGGGGGVVTATGSASATAGTPWMPTTSYLVSSINGSALLPYGFSSVSANSANWNATRTAVTANSASWNSVYNTVYSNSASWSGSTGGGSVTSPSGTILVINGNEVEGTNSAVLTVSEAGFEEVLRAYNQFFATSMQLLTNDAVPDTGATLMVQLGSTVWADTRVILSGRDTGYGYTSASGIIPTGVLTASIPMDGITRDISASADQWVSLANGQLTAKKEGGILVTGVGELAWKTAVDNVTNTVSANSATWGQVGVDSATVSAIASSYAESAASSKLDTSAQVVTSTASAYDMDGYAWTTEINGLGISAARAYSASYANTAETAYSADFASSSDKAIYDTDGRFLSSLTDSATVSAIASSYAESAVSGKMDKSAIDYTRTDNGTQIYASGIGTSTNQFSAKNDSAGAAIIAGTYARVRLWDSAATGNIYASSISTWNNKMDGSAVQSAYASASATQATANGVLYILIPDGA